MDLDYNRIGGTSGTRGKNLQHVACVERDGADSVRPDACAGEHLAARGRWRHVHRRLVLRGRDGVETAVVGAAEHPVVARDDAVIARPNVNRKKERGIVGVAEGPAL